MESEQFVPDPAWKELADECDERRSPEYKERLRAAIDSVHEKYWEILSGRMASIKPIIVFCFPQITREAVAHLRYSIGDALKDSGWISLILDGFDKMDVRAFGVPESKLGEFEELKAMIESKMKNENA